MSSPPPYIVPMFLRRLAPAALLAATATLGGAAVGDPAVACAKPKYDKGQYELCAASVSDAVLAGQIKPEHENDALRQCCELHGGLFIAWVNPGYGLSGMCVEGFTEQIQPQPGLPPRPLPGDITATLEPAAPANPTEAAPVG